MGSTASLRKHKGTKAWLTNVKNNIRIPASAGILIFSPVIPAKDLWSRLAGGIPSYHPALVKSPKYKTQAKPFRFIFNHVKCKFSFNSVNR
jgi:hypothetical protein